MDSLPSKGVDGQAAQTPTKKHEYRRVQTTNETTHVQGEDQGITAYHNCQVQKWTEL